MKKRWILHGQKVNSQTAFFIFYYAFIIFYIEQIPTIYLGVKDTRLVCLLVVVSLLISIGALFLGIRLGLSKALSPFLP